MSWLMIAIAAAPSPRANASYKPSTTLIFASLTAFLPAAQLVDSRRAGRCTRSSIVLRLHHAGEGDDGKRREYCAQHRVSGLRPLPKRRALEQPPVAVGHFHALRKLGARGSSRRAAALLAEIHHRKRDVDRIERWLDGAVALLAARRHQRALLVHSQHAGDSDGDEHRQGAQRTDGRKAIARHQAERRRERP